MRENENEEDAPVIVPPEDLEFGEDGWSVGAVEVLPNESTRLERGRAESRFVYDFSQEIRAAVSGLLRAGDVLERSHGAGNDDMRRAASPPTRREDEEAAAAAAARDARLEAKRASFRIQRDRAGRSPDRERTNEKTEKKKRIVVVSFDVDEDG